jgi:hypothetical protein
MNKAFILEEIRRTARANDGTPLGWRRFSTESGIRPCEWLGKLWARWGDALREAGFTPNGLQRPYPTAEVLDKYARFAQELGRLPSANELRLRRYGKRDFPSLEVFRRLGRKGELVHQVLTYCRGRDEYADVMRLCEEYTAPQGRVAAQEGPDDEAVGFVYLLKSGRFYKIGKSKAVGRRTHELARQLPERTVTVHLIRTDDPGGIEAYWHKRFAAKRQHGEWFKLTAADVAAFRRRAFM